MLNNNKAAILTLVLGLMNLSTSTNTTNIDHSRMIRNHHHNATQPNVSHQTKERRDSNQIRRREELRRREEVKRRGLDDDAIRREVDNRAQLIKSTWLTSTESNQNNINNNQNNNNNNRMINPMESNINQNINTNRMINPMESKEPTQLNNNNNMNRMISNEPITNVPELRSNLINDQPTHHLMKSNRDNLAIMNQKSNPTLNNNYQMDTPPTTTNPTINNHQPTQQQQQQSKIQSTKSDNHIKSTDMEAKFESQNQDQNHRQVKGSPQQSIQPTNQMDSKLSAPLSDTLISSEPILPSNELTPVKDQPPSSPSSDSSDSTDSPSSLDLDPPTTPSSDPSPSTAIISTTSPSSNPSDPPPQPEDDFEACAKFQRHCRDIQCKSPDNISLMTCSPTLTCECHDTQSSSSQSPQSSQSSRFISNSQHPTNSYLMDSSSTQTTTSSFTFHYLVYPYLYLLLLDIVIQFNP